MHVLLERGFWKAGKMKTMREGEIDDKREKSLVVTAYALLCQFPVGQLTVGTVIKNL